MSKKYFLLIISLVILLIPTIPILADTCNHVWVFDYDNEPTCILGGYKVYSCSICYATRKEDIPPTGIHTYEIVDQESPTCTIDGYIKRSCTQCSDFKVEVIPATGLHKMSNWTVDRQPTCSTKGIETRYCTECFKEETRDIAIDKTAHDWSEWYYYESPTVFKKGTNERECNECGLVEHESVPKLKPVIKLNKTSKTLSVGKSFTISLKRFSYGDSVKSYKSSNTKIVTVDKNGKVTAVKKGKATITVKLKSGISAKCKITVK